MAEKKGKSKKKNRGKQNKRVKRYTVIHKFAVGASLLTFFLIIVQGVRAEVSVVTITYRSFLVCLAIYMITRVVVKAWASFEEISNSGEG